MTVMLGRVHTEAVWSAIGEVRPQKVSNLVQRTFDRVLLNLRDNTGEVLLTPDSLAEALKCSATEVAGFLAVLERIGAIYRKGEMRFINPHVAWSGDLKARAIAAELVPPPLPGRLG